MKSKTGMVVPTAEELDARWKTLLWRQEELERAGYDVLSAMELAERLDVDLHLACDLLRRGATPEQAVSILL